MDLVDKMDGEANGFALSGEGTADRLFDPPASVGAEADIPLRIEAVDRFHQAEVSFGNEIEEGETAVVVIGGEFYNETEVRFDHEFACGGVATADAFGEGDLFAAIEQGADTFDCVSTSRVARNSAVYSTAGRYNLLTSANRRRFEPIDAECTCYTCTHYTRAYLHHGFKAKEMIASTLATIHNEHFIVTLVDRIRASIENGDFDAYRTEFEGRYYAGTTS